MQHFLFLTKKRTLSFYVAFTTHQKMSIQTQHQMPSLPTKRTLTKIALTSKIIITGDLNFASSNWSTMSSANQEAEQMLDVFVDFNFEQLIFSENSKSLYVVLTNEPYSIVSLKNAVSFLKLYRINQTS